MCGVAHALVTYETWNVFYRCLPQLITVKYSTVDIINRSLTNIRKNAEPLKFKI